MKKGVYNKYSFEVSSSFMRRLGKNWLWWSFKRKERLPLPRRSWESAKRPRVWLFPPGGRNSASSRRSPSERSGSRGRPSARHIRSAGNAPSNSQRTSNKRATKRNNASPTAPSRSRTTASPAPAPNNRMRYLPSESLKTRKAWTARYWRPRWCCNSWTWTETITFIRSTTPFPLQGCAEWLSIWLYPFSICSGVFDVEMSPTVFKMRRSGQPQPGNIDRTRMECLCSGFNYSSSDFCKISLVNIFYSSLEFKNGFCSSLCRGSNAMALLDVWWSILGARENERWVGRAQFDSKINYLKLKSWSNQE